jgi:alkaline phosphatase D
MSFSLKPAFGYSAFLFVLVSVAANSACAQSPRDGVMPRAARDPARLTHGPMLGLSMSDGVPVWIRTSDPTAFDVRYGKVPDRLDQIARGGMTTIEHDNTGTLELKGLDIDTVYHYQVEVRNRPHGMPGRFRTLPSEEATRNDTHNPNGLFNFRFQVGSCANQNPDNGAGHRTKVYEHLNRDWTDKVHFHIMNGDWLYEEVRDYPAEAWRLTNAVDKIPTVVSVAPTITGVWENYKLYLSRGSDLATWHRNMPSVFTFDDHELVNDIWGSGEAGKRHRRTVFRDIGTQAWFDYLGWANPMQHNHPIHFGTAAMKAGSDLLRDETADFSKMPIAEMTNLHVHWGTLEAGVNDMRFDNNDGHANSYVYDIVEVVDKHTLRLHKPAVVDEAHLSYSIGRRSYGKFRVSNCEFYMLDTRGDRDMHDLSDRGKKSLSMLGTAQRQWLLRSMQASDAEFMFVISTVPFMIPHSGAGGFEMDAENKEEAWTGFIDERETLIDAWEKLGSKVFVMTGDLHNSFAIKVTDNVWEFCCGPHNSVNHVPKLDESDRPATGKWKFGPREVDIRWSSYVLEDVPRTERLFPYFCVVQVNNVFNMPKEPIENRWVAYPHPQIVFQYYDGRTGDLAYAEAISTNRED